MLSNTWDANRCFASADFLGYTKHILVIRMVRKIKYKDTTRMILYITSHLISISRMSRDIQGITKKVRKLELFIFTITI